MSTNKDLKLAIFISGRGSNMKALVESCQDDSFPASVSVVLSYDPDAAGLDFAREHVLKTESVNHKDFDTREDFEDALLKTLSNYEVDLICLAGFMRVLTSHFLNALDMPIINIHPSLLPKYKGLNTHERAIEAGDCLAGCTVHFVVPDIDSGEVIVQKSVPIMKGDTAGILAARVLEQEHSAYTQAVKIIAEK